jgi:hypothetical protein
MLAKHLLFTGLIGLTVIPSVRAADFNLLPNGDFSQQNQLAGWTCAGGSWSSDDADSSAGSGSLWLQNFGFAAGQCTTSCIAVRPGAAYNLGGQSRILLGNPVITFACASTGTTQCNSETYDLQGPAMSTANAWTAAASAGGYLGSGVQSIKCTVTLGSQDLGSISGHFDNLFFSTDVLFFNGFEP